MDLPLINDIAIDEIKNSIVMLETSADTWLIARYMKERKMTNQYFSPGRLVL